MHNNATTCFEKDTPWQIFLPYEDKIQFNFWSLVGCQCDSMEISKVVFNHSSQAKKKVLKDNDDNLSWNACKIWKHQGCHKHQLHMRIQVGGLLTIEQ
jgi:hypothetical protein